MVKYLDKYPEFYIKFMHINQIYQLIFIEVIMYHYVNVYNGIYKNRVDRIKINEIN